jgi:hypothetical protein
MQGRSNGDIGAVKIIRGVVQMHTVNGHQHRKALPLIHTTELRGGLVRESQRRTIQDRRTLTGPAVLLPRVGEPKKEKIALYLRRDPVVLSDCVIGLKCKSQEKAKSLGILLKEYWGVVQSAYGGTCAKYSTLSSLKKVCAGLGIRFTR